MRQSDKNDKRRKSPRPIEGDELPIGWWLLLTSVTTKAYTCIEACIRHIKTDVKRDMIGQGSLGLRSNDRSCDTTFELHYSISDLARQWRLGRETVRPSADVLKPANDGHFKTGQQGGTRQEYLYTVRGGMSKYFLGKRSGAVYTERTWAEDTATQGCDRSADSAAGMARSGASRSASHAAILAQQR